MDRNSKILAVAVVIVLVAAAATSIVMLSGSDDDVKKSTGSGRALVYGNADNDDYFDNDDVELIRQIAESDDWDERKYPLADANYDGVVDQKDVDYAQSLLDGERNRMYYIGCYGDVYYINYPQTGHIAATNDYGLMMAQLLDVYDRITAANSTVLKYSESRYPGIQSKIDLGSSSSSDLPSFVENLLDTDCTMILGAMSLNTYNMLRESGKEVDMIMLSPSAEIEKNDGDCIAHIMTCGILLDKGDEAREFAEYYEQMDEYLKNKFAGAEEESYILVYNPSNAVTVSVHTYGDNGSAKGDWWVLDHLPLYTDFEWNRTGNNGTSTGVEIESIITLNPEILVICLWNAADDDSDPEEVQKKFDEAAEYFKETSAYKNGKVYGVNYEMYGTYLGIGGLALLASYIWPDSYDEEEGWELLQEAVDRFTLIKGDVHDLGGMIPYKINTTA